MVGLPHVPIPLLHHTIPPLGTTTSPMSSALSPPLPLAWLSPWLSLSLLFSHFFSFLRFFVSHCRLEESPLDSSPP